jgi:CheY-like chemotaxis protein
MPAHDGFELLRRVRADYRPTSTLVIALTGSAFLSDRETALKAGFVAHLANPLERPALINATDEVLTNNHKEQECAGIA